MKYLGLFSAHNDGDNVKAWLHISLPLEKIFFCRLDEVFLLGFLDCFFRPSKGIRTS